MSSRKLRMLAGACALAAAGAWIVPAGAQTAEVKEKPRMYTYVSNWAIPRAQWAEMDKGRATTAKIFEKALSSGTIVGYGDDLELVHQVDGGTHDSWWSAMSLAGVLNVLEDLHKAGTAPVLNSATKHWDNLYVSRFYNWRSGSWHGAYSHESSYKLKADAPDDAVETLSKNLIVPMLEKLIADGTLLEYEIDEQAVHTQSPDTFWIITIAKSAEGEDKISAAIRDTLKANPLAGPAFGSMVDFTPHRDDLSRTEAVYK